jgi:hypothetical protein
VYFIAARSQVRSREEELMNLGSLHTATKAAADKRIAELEGRVTRLLEANRCGLGLSGAFVRRYGNSRG